MIANEQDPRVIRTRQLLQKALLEYLQEKPFQSITVSDLTERANLNRATFYLHYLDKYDLLSKTARDTFISTINHILPDWSRFEINDIRYLTEATCDYLFAFLKDCAPANKPYEPLIENELQRVLYDYIYCWLDNAYGNPSNTLPIETCAIVCSASILNMSLKWSRGETAYSKDEVVEEVYKVITRGILHVVPQKIG